MLSFSSDLSRKINHLDLTVLAFMSFFILSIYPIFSIFYNAKVSMSFFLVGSLLLVSKHSQHLYVFAKGNRQIALGLILFNGWAWLSGGFSIHQGLVLVSNAMLLNYTLLFIWFFVIAERLKQNNCPSEYYYLKYHRLIFYFLSLLGLIGTVEYTFPDFGVSSNIILSLKYYPRVSSLVGNPNPLGVLMYLGLGLGILLKKQRSINSSSFYFGAFFLLASGSLAASRNGWLVFLTFIFLGYIHRLITAKDVVIYFVLWLCSLLCFPNSFSRMLLMVHGQSCEMIQVTSEVSYYALFKSGSVSSLVTDLIYDPSSMPESVSTALSRLVVWKAAFAEVVKHPLTGIGNGAFKEISVFGPGLSTNHAHNLFLEISVGMGIPGLILFLNLLTSIIYKAKNSKNNMYVLVILILISQIFDFFGRTPAFMIASLYIFAFSCSSSNGLSAVKAID